MSSILVTGSTGNVGSATVKHLARLLNENNKSGYTISAGVRNEQKAADKFKDIKLNNSNNKLKFVNTETSSDNKTPEDKLKNAFNGIDTLVVLPPGAGRVEVALSYVEAAKSANVKNIILLSVSSAGNESVTFGRQWKEIEAAIKNTGINYVFIRSPFFLDNHWGNVGSIKSQSAFYYPVKGDSKYVQTSTNDIGEAIATVAVNIDNHKNKVYTVTSNEAVSCNEYAKLYSELAGKTVNFVQVPDQAAIDSMVKAWGLPEWQAKGIVELFNLADKNDDAATKPTSDFKSITGHEPTNPRDFVKQLAGALK